ncbi:MAG: class I SAM-dependent methyltransferase [Candidatus Competibacterales bacterium]
MSPPEPATDPWLPLKAMAREWREACRVAVRDYPHPRFLAGDALLMAAYACHNPYGLHRRFWTRRGCDAPYGETFLTTLQTAAQRLALKPGDVVYDLGCGRGRVALWLACFTPAQVVGIDLQPVFVRRAAAMARVARVPRLTFRHGDWLTADLRDATAVYLYGTTLTEASMPAALDRLHTLPPGARVVTVSYALGDYGAWGFDLEDRWLGEFPWGVTELNLQRRR